MEKIKKIVMIVVLAILIAPALVSAKQMKLILKLNLDTELQKNNIII